MKMRILVVDDDFMIRKLLKFKLSKRGFEVATAANEKEFWDKVFTTKPDLIILDIWLQKKSGPYIYQNLVEFVGFDANIPIIFITAFLEKDSVPRRHPAGSHCAVLSKPFDFEELMSEIDHLLHSGDQKPVSPGVHPKERMREVVYEE